MNLPDRRSDCLRVPTVSRPASISRVRQPKHQPKRRPRPDARLILQAPADPKRRLERREHSGQACV
jgi:hypothetical protein